MPIFEWRSVMPASADEVFAYHARPGAFRRLAPPWQKLEVLEESGDVTAGASPSTSGSVPSSGTGWPRWAAPCRAGSSSTGNWRVRSPRGSTCTGSCPSTRARASCWTTSSTSLPAGGLTDSVGEGPAGKTLSRLFRFRHERTRLDLGRHAEWADRPRLKVAIAGASGLIGSHLADYLTTAGHQVVRLVRNKEAGPGEIPWDPATGALVPRRLSRASTPSSTSPASSLFGIWTPGRKKAILEQPRAVDADACRGDRPHGITAVGLHQRVRGGRLRLPRR